MAWLNALSKTQRFESEGRRSTKCPYFGNQHWVLSQNWFSNASSFRTNMHIRDHRIEKPELSHIFSQYFFPYVFPICFHTFHVTFPYFSLTSSRAEAVCFKHLHRGLDGQDAHAVWSGRSGSGLATGLLIFGKIQLDTLWLCQNSYYWKWPLE